MAVSNAIGSNVFDIFVCLGLPWFIKTTMVSPGTDVVVHSKGKPIFGYSYLPSNANNYAESISA